MEVRIAILTCLSDYAVATKVIKADENGVITKEPYNCGKKFTYREEVVHDIHSLGKLVRSLEDKFKESLFAVNHFKTIRPRLYLGAVKVIKRQPLALIKIKLLNILPHGLQSVTPKPITVN